VIEGDKQATERIRGAMKIFQETGEGDSSDVYADERLLREVPASSKGSLKGQENG
jgi:hypothetical protein